MHDGEKPVTRAYVLVEDIEAAVAAAAASGAVIAVPPMEIAGHGTCAIYFQGGIEAGLWQL
jgi:predicted enzyme related to lactoylglutathione lyase